MFQKTRITLTAWYLLIIMLVSASFSIVIYRVLTSELDRIEHIERIRIERRQVIPGPFLDPEVIAETKQRIMLTLIEINAAILAGSAVAGYFLAGRTLRPIADMVDEQNRFITDASHELRTPLTSLKSEIEVNLRDSRMTIPKAKQLLRSNLEEVNNLQTLSENLMKLTQFSTENNEMETTQLELSAIVREAIRRTSVAAKTKHIKITRHGENFTLTANATLLTELFIILLDNAMKYSARGKSIGITAEKTDEHAIIRVRDQGFGIRKEDIPRLFDRFWRADRSRSKTNIPGYGLGLAIAKQIVDRHHGTISVKSEIGRGSTFIVTIPIQEDN